MAARKLGFREVSERRRFDDPRRVGGHRVADFNTLDDLVAHARDELGATHIESLLKRGTGEGEVRLYFPRADGSFDEANVWRKGGYWHAEGPSARKKVATLPSDAVPIKEYGNPRRSFGYTDQRRANEAPRMAAYSRTRSRKGEARKYWIVDQVQGGLWYQVGYFHAKGEAERFARTVPGRTRIVHTWATHNYPIAR